MKTTIIIALFAGAAAGAGSSAVSSVFISNAPTATTLAAVDPLDDTDALFGLVAHLSEENESLLDRMQVLESQLAMASVQRMPALVAPTESTDDLVQLSASLKPPTQRESSVVRLVLEEIKAEEDAKRTEERRVREDNRLDEQITRLTESLGLDPGQAKSMRSILANQTIRRTEMFAAMRDGAGGIDRTTMRETFSELNNETNNQVQLVLSPTQYDNYTENNGNRGFGRDWGGDRGGNRGDRSNR